MTPGGLSHFAETKSFLGRGIPALTGKTRGGIALKGTLRYYKSPSVTAPVTNEPVFIEHFTRERIANCDSFDQCDIDLKGIKKWRRENAMPAALIWKFFGKT